MDAKNLGIHFRNDVPYTEEFNTYTYRNFYNGGGVALGDVNNDGLVDIYFTGNMVDNKLYINKGNWKFQDVTESAGLSCKNVWSTGATMVDINGDNLLDIYVCKAGKPGGINRNNELFINQGNLKFKESSKEYGLDITGLSIHAAFFDYDKDGDMDCYILNNSLKSVGAYDYKKDQRLTNDIEGNKLMRNDNGKYVDVSKEIGIYNSNIGYGLGITLSDFNWDSWPDIFISNDFFERDYLYLNNQDGTFSEVGDQSFASMSMGSMGADAADLDNDLLPDLFVTEMLPSTLERKKTKAQYETWDKYKEATLKGYHHQFSRNVLQKNIGDGKFVELSRYSGVAASDWSWSALLQDFDNDGLKDIFITNGIYKDLLDRDYINYFADENIIRSKLGKNEKVLTGLIDSLSSTPVENSMFRNHGRFHFSNVSSKWGLDQKTFSNGAAYGDLDNDGDLDLVINNVNMPCSIYKNNTDTLTNRSIQFKLQGSTGNTMAIGAKVILKHQSGEQYVEHFTAKGFESSVDFTVHCGTGNVTVIDTAIIIWPNDKVSYLTNLETNEIYTLKQIEAKEGKPEIIKSKPNEHCNQIESIDFHHKDIDINLFARERLLLEMGGFDGPGIAVGDVNGDEKDDIFCGGGKNQNSVLYLSKGSSYTKVTKPFELESKSEVVKAVFFDSDGDGDDDLYVAHGGKAFSEVSTELHDVLYINDKAGNFIRKYDFVNFPKSFSTGDIDIGDLNGDGLLDIAIGEKVNTNFFGISGDLFLLINKGNNTYSCNRQNHYKEVGMISDVEIADMNNDHKQDIVVAGKWMPIKILLNSDGYQEQTNRWLDIKNTIGLWNEMYIDDVDADGHADIIAGNEGKNNFYQKGISMWMNDFDGNGSAEQIICEEINSKYYPIHDLDELFSQLPMIKRKFVFYGRAAKQDMNSLFGKKITSNSRRINLDETKSLILLNTDGNFQKLALPEELQFAPIHAIAKLKDKYLFGGNFYNVKPQFGRQDASYGWSLKIQKDTKSILFKDINSLGIDGQIRQISKFNDGLVFGINNEKLIFCK